MRKRRDFIAAITGSVAIALTSKTAEGAPSPPAGSGTPAPASPALPPKPHPTGKAPSEAALAVAMTMRRFDRKLTNDEIATIAHGIDDSAKAAAALNPGGKQLHNWDEPVTTFRADAK